MSVGDKIMVLFIRTGVDVIKALRLGVMGALNGRSVPNVFLGL